MKVRNLGNLFNGDPWLMVFEDEWMTANDSEKLFWVKDHLFVWLRLSRDPITGNTIPELLADDHVKQHDPDFMKKYGHLL